MSIQFHMTSSDELTKRILDLEGMLAGLGPPPKMTRETCPVPACAHWRAEASGANEYWRSHFNMRHPQFRSAYLGYYEDEVSVQSADGTIVVHQKPGINLRTTNYFLGFSEDGRTEWTGMSRTAIKMCGEHDQFNTETVETSASPVRGFVTHFALFDSYHGGSQVTDWEKLASPIQVSPLDNLRVNPGGLITIFDGPPKSTAFPREGLGPLTTAAIGDYYQRYPAPPSTLMSMKLDTDTIHHPQPRPAKAKEDMAYRVRMAKRYGFNVRVDMADGGTWQYWRPTEKWADNVGYKRLAREVAKIERRERAEKVRTMTWGHIRGTANMDSSKDHAEWDAAFNERNDP